jgi:hypothetical protein
MNGWAIFDSSPSMFKRLIERQIVNRVKGALAEPPGPWPKVIKRDFGGDPFQTLIEFDGRHYILNEAELIESEELAMFALREDPLGDGYP